jgi:hypothetical protein
MTSLREIEAIHAEVNYYRDSVALLRARLYRRGMAATARLEELQRMLESAERRLRAARATLPRQTEPSQQSVQGFKDIPLTAKSVPGDDRRSTVCGRETHD